MIKYYTKTELLLHYNASSIEEIEAQLAENTIIRKEGDKFEVVFLNQDTVDAINTPLNEYVECKNYKIEEKYNEQ